MKAFATETVDPLELHPLHRRMVEEIQRIVASLPQSCVQAGWTEAECARGRRKPPDKGMTLELLPTNQKTASIRITFWREGIDPHFPPNVVVCSGRDFSYDVIDWTYYTLKPNPDAVGLLRRIVLGIIKGKYTEELSYLGSNLLKSKHIIADSPKPFGTSHIYGFGLFSWRKRRTEAHSYEPYVGSE